MRVARFVLAVGVKRQLSLLLCIELLTRNVLELTHITESHSKSDISDKWAFDFHDRSGNEGGSSTVD